MAVLGKAYRSTLQETKHSSISSLEVIKNEQFISPNEIGQKFTGDELRAQEIQST